MNLEEKHHRFQLSSDCNFALSYSTVKQKHLVDGFYINSAINLKVQHPGRPQATTYRRFDSEILAKTHIHFIKKGEGRLKFLVGDLYVDANNVSGETRLRVTFLAF